jgi:hypothetical protein
VLLGTPRSPARWSRSLWGELLQRFEAFSKGVDALLAPVDMGDVCPELMLEYAGARRAAGYARAVS